MIADTFVSNKNEIAFETMEAIDKNEVELGTKTITQALEIGKSTK